MDMLAEMLLFVIVPGFFFFKFLNLFIPLKPGKSGFSHGHLMIIFAGGILASLIIDLLPFEVVAYSNYELGILASATMGLVCMFSLCFKKIIKKLKPWQKVKRFLKK